MTATDPTPDTSDSAPASTPEDIRAEIVEQLYDVALDPIRLEELLDTWEDHLAPLRGGQTPADDPGIDAHITRAQVFLDRFEATR